MISTALRSPASSAASLFVALCFIGPAVRFTEAAPGVGELARGVGDPTPGVGHPTHGLAGDELPAGLRWDARAVEHVWNRAGFGIPEHAIQRWVEAGPDALIAHLLAPRPLDRQPLAPRFAFNEPRIDPVEYEQRTIDQRRAYRKTRSRVHRSEFARFRASFVQRILDQEDPLRDRMTLFWHGVFTSSYETVRHPAPIVQQHHTLRDGALGSYETLLRSMLRDPALLQYLNNDLNRKGRPNENLAREVMELFSLGEGSGYTEDDVREAARALTGAGITARDVGGRYRFSPSQHDPGEKVILGTKGRHRPDDLATLLVQRPECAQFIARSVIEYLEGLAPDEARVERYAGVLRSTGYDVSFLVGQLLRDPAFYRDEVIGGRIASPLDYVAGTAIRSGLEVPAAFVVEATSVLGQDLFRPPNVKGWEEGLAWITTASFMLRGNIAGAMLGRVDADGIRDDASAFVDGLKEAGEMESMDDDSMRALQKEQMRRDELMQLVGVLAEAKYRAEGALTDVVAQGLPAGGVEVSDEAVALALANELLPVEPPAETVRMLAARLKDLRRVDGTAAAHLLDERERAEPMLRELAHLLLSLPEAQIH